MSAYIHLREPNRETALVLPSAYIHTYIHTWVRILLHCIHTHIHTCIHIENYESQPIMHVETSTQYIISINFQGNARPDTYIYTYIHMYKYKKLRIIHSLAQEISKGRHSQNSLAFPQISRYTIPMYVQDHGR